MYTCRKKKNINNTEFVLQAITDLNHAGVCMSYDRTWDHLKQLTSEAAR